MNYGMRMAEDIDRRNGWVQKQKRMNATQNLARVLGVMDHRDKAVKPNLTKEPSWTSWR